MGKSNPITKSDAIIGVALAWAIARIGSIGSVVGIYPPSF
jgi:hypothetical protein